MPKRLSKCCPFKKKKKLKYTEKKKTRKRNNFVGVRSKRLKITDWCPMNNI